MPKVCSGKGEHACLVFISWDLRSGSMVSTALHWAQPDKRWKQDSCNDRISHTSSRKYHVLENYFNISFVLLIFALKHGIINVPKQNYRIKAILHQYNAKGNSEHPRDARRKGAWALFVMGRGRSNGATVWVGNSALRRWTSVFAMHDSAVTGRRNGARSTRKTKYCKEEGMQ